MKKTYLLIFVIVVIILLLLFFARNVVGHQYSNTSFISGKTSICRCIGEVETKFNPINDPSHWSKCKGIEVPFSCKVR